MKVHKNMTISEIIELIPKSAEVLTEIGLNCINCPMRSMETLEEGAKGHGLKDEEIDKIIEKINQLGEKNEI